MTTTVPPVRPSLENLNTVQALAQALDSLHYPVVNMDEATGSIMTGIRVGERNYPLLIDISDDGSAADFEVKIANASVLPDEPQQLAAACMGLLAINSQIAPFAVAVYPPEHESGHSSDESPITLVSEVPLGDFCTAELESALMSCRRAIIAVTNNLASLAPASVAAVVSGSCGHGCGCGAPASKPKATAGSRR